MSKWTLFRSADSNSSPFFDHAGLDCSELKYIQLCTDMLGIFTYTHKYITNNFYISFEALTYPLQEI